MGTTQLPTQLALVTHWLRTGDARPVARRAIDERAARIARAAEEPRIELLYSGTGGQIHDIRQVAPNSYWSAIELRQ